jgi:hypothetical protein
MNTTTDSFLRQRAYMAGCAAACETLSRRQAEAEAQQSGYFDTFMSGYDDYNSLTIEEESDSFCEF